MITRNVLFKVLMPCELAFTNMSYEKISEYDMRQGNCFVMDKKHSLSNQQCCRLQWQAADTEKNLEAELGERSEVTGQLEEVRRWLRETAQMLQTAPASLDPDDIAQHAAKHEVEQSTFSEILKSRQHFTNR